jgi:hypothetical protein
MSHQQSCSGTFPSLLRYSLVQFLDLRLEFHIHRLQLIPPIKQNNV